MAPHLFIDGKNCAYRSIYANHDMKYHNMTVMLRFIHSWFELCKPASVNVFWDADRKTVWRRKILSEYKDRKPPRPLPNQRNILEELQLLQTISSELFTVMNIRQYSKKTQEADDLIYAACRHVYPQEVVIISSDGDFTQIPYYMRNVSVWEPRASKWVNVPQYNPVIKKALMGDSPDNIHGYDGIGEVKSTRLASCNNKLQEFLGTSDREIFVRNMMLVDLSLSPHILPNQLYVARQMMSPVTYDRKVIFDLITKYKLNGVFQEYDRIVLPFKSINQTFVG